MPCDTSRQKGAQEHNIILAWYGELGSACRHSMRKVEVMGTEESNRIKNRDYKERGFLPLSLHMVALSTSK